MAVPRTRRARQLAAALLLIAGAGLVVPGEAAVAEPGDISTIAGNDVSRFPIDEVWNSGFVGGVAFDGDAMYYAVNAGNGSVVIRRDLDSGQDALVAGSSTSQGFSGDGGPGLEAEFASIGAVAVHSGDIYVADTDNGRVRRIDGDDGSVSTVAGNGSGGPSGDGGAATDAAIGMPTDIAFDATGNLYIGTRSANVRKVDSGGNISTVVGSDAGSTGTSGLGGLPTDALLGGDVGGIAFANDGTFYVSDSSNARVLKVNSAFTEITELIAAPEIAVGAWLDRPALPIATTATGSVLVGDSGNARLLSVDPITGSSTLVTSSVEDSCQVGATVDAVAGVQASAIARMPSGVIVVAGLCEGVALTMPVMVRFDPDSGAAGEILGSQPTNGDGGEAYFAALHTPADAARVGNALYVAEVFGNRIRKIDLATGLIDTIAGDGVGASTGDGGPAVDARLFRPLSVTATADGSALLIGSADARIRSIDLQTGIIDTIAGTGVEGFDGDGGPATSAKIGAAVSGIAVAPNGDTYFTTPNVSAIRCIGCDGEGIISTVVGGPGATQLQDGFSGLSTVPATAWDVVIAPDGAVVWSEVATARVRRLDPVSDVVETIAGQFGNPGSTGDGEPATDATLMMPTGLRYDAAGNLDICDVMAKRIRRVDTNGIIDTLAGNGDSDGAGDGGPAVDASLANPISITSDAGTHLYVIDAYPGTVRRIEGAQPDLAVSGQNRQVRPGDSVPLTVTLHNAGSAFTTPPLVVEVTIPDGLEYESVASTGWSCAENSQAVLCTSMAPLANGASQDFVVNARVADSASGSLTVPVVATSDSDDADPTNQSVDVVLVVTTDEVATTTAPPPDVVSADPVEAAPGPAGSLPRTGGTPWQLVGFACLFVGFGMLLWGNEQRLFYRPKHRPAMAWRAESGRRNLR